MVDSSPVVASVADGRVVAGVVDSSPVVTSVVDGRVVAGVVDSSAVVSSRSLLLFVSNKPVSQNSHNPCGFDFAQAFALGESKQGKILHHLSLQLLHRILRVVSGIDVVR